ncbi:hypothetical protein Droror1_Dr00011797 [Drosera rotundifolia]
MRGDGWCDNGKRSGRSRAEKAESFAWKSQQDRELLLTSFGSECLLCATAPTPLPIVTPPITAHLIAALHLFIASLRPILLTADVLSSNQQTPEKAATAEYGRGSGYKHGNKELSTSCIRLPPLQIKHNPPPPLSDNSSANDAEHDWEPDGWGPSPLTPFPHSFKLFKLHFPPKRLQTRSLLIPRFCTSRVSTLSPTPNSLAGTLMTSPASTPPKSMDAGLWFPSSSHFPALVPISPFQFEIQALDFPVSPLLIFPFPHIPISRIRNPTNRPAPHLIASEELKGKIDYRHAYVDFSKLEVTVPKQGGDNEVVKTCPAAMGFGFAAGTTDGPGAFDFKQGDAKVSDILF